jgi:monoamine oxidase
MNAKTPYDVVIVGAGIAGLAAAQKLKQSNLSILVIEAKDRIGGRIHTDHTIAPVPIDIGAELLHEPPSRALTRELNIETDAGLGIHFYDNGKWRNIEELPALEDLDWPTPKKQDEPLLQYLERIGLTRDKWPYELKLLEADTEHLSRWSTLATVLRASEKEDVPDMRIKGGLSRLIEPFITGLDIQLNTVVTTIEWNQESVCLHIQDGPPILAKQVILTLPLGVLKARKISFSPELPAKKWQAIDSLGIVDAVKLIYHFAEPVLPENASALMLENQLPHFWWCSSGNYKEFKGEILIGWATGDAARKLTNMGEEQALSTGISNLKRILNHSDLQPVSAKMTNWSKDPFALGAYSYTPPGALHARSELAAPTMNKIFWAGEATHEQYYGSIDGGLESGKRAASEVLAITKH